MEKVNCLKRFSKGTQKSNLKEVPEYHESTIMWQEIWNRPELLSPPQTHQPKLKSVQMNNYISMFSTFEVRDVNILQIPYTSSMKQLISPKFICHLIHDSDWSIAFQKVNHTTS